MIKEVKEGLIINIRVSPNASKNEIIISDDMIKLKITTQPLEGKANKAVIELLSKQLKVPKSNFEIVKGQTSKDKTILIKLSNPDKVTKVQKFFNKN